jgi:hypothetical protein
MNKIKFILLKGTKSDVSFLNKAQEENTSFNLDKYTFTMSKSLMRNYLKYYYFISFHKSVSKSNDRTQKDD